MPTFQDADNLPAMVPEGDYIFTVRNCEAALSTGAQTKGSDQFTLTLDLVSEDGKTKGRAKDNLIDHQSCAWKFDVLLKSAGLKLARGEAFDFRAATAKAAGIRHIDPVGLRGWCHIYHDTYTKPGTTNERKSCKVDLYYTDRPKLPRLAPEPERDPFAGNTAAASPEDF